MQGEEGAGIEVGDVVFFCWGGGVSEGTFFGAGKMGRGGLTGHVARCPVGMIADGLLGLVGLGVDGEGEEGED